MTRGRVDDQVMDQLASATRRLCPAWLREQRDDLVQMAAMKLLRSRTKAEFTPAFLTRVAYSVVIDEIRRRRRRKEVGMSPSMPDRIANSADLSPETIACGAHLGEQLAICVGSLPPDRRRAVTLYLQDHTIPEIAEMLGWNRKRASNTVYRALAQLRSHLDERGIVP